jgi:hypothetical protein
VLFKTWRWAIVLKVSPFRRGETIDYSSKILLQFTKTCIFGFQN